MHVTPIYASSWANIHVCVSVYICINSMSGVFTVAFIVTALWIRLEAKLEAKVPMLEVTISTLPYSQRRTRCIHKYLTGMNFDGPFDFIRIWMFSELEFIESRHEFFPSHPCQVAPNLFPLQCDKVIELISCLHMVIRNHPWYHPFLSELLQGLTSFSVARPERDGMSDSL